MTWEEKKVYHELKSKEPREWEEVRFEGGILEEGLLEDQVYVECEFQNCQFLSSRIRSCHFRSCTFQNCVFVGIEWEFSIMRNAVLLDCVCVGINWDLLRTKSMGSEILYEAHRTFFKYCSFFQMNLNRFRFEDCRFQESCCEECKMREAHFESVSLDKTRFHGCDLRKADFRNASGYGIDLESNRLQEAKFSFPEVIRLLEGMGIQIE